MSANFYTLLCCIGPLFACAKGGNTSTPALLLENKGQVKDQSGKVRSDIDFKVARTGGTVFFGPGVVHYQWWQRDKRPPVSGAQKERRPSLRAAHVNDSTLLRSCRMDVTLLGANPKAAFSVEGPSAFFEQYFIGNEARRARAWQKVRYQDVYPNIDWVLYCNEAGQLEYDFVVRPGGKVSDIRLRYSGADNLRLNKDGSITATTAMGSITEHAPHSVDASGKTIASSFILEKNVVRFAAAPYKGTLTIDPTLEWATFYGGEDLEYGRATACDPAGNVYLFGETQSVGNIATTGSHQATITDLDGFHLDVFLVKFNSKGVRQWATYYGGSMYETAKSVTCDGDGNVFICGSTVSWDNMATPGCHQSSFTDTTEWFWYDCYLAKFDSTGVRQWGTYFGSYEAEEEPHGLACDPAGNVYMSGEYGIARTPTPNPTAIATPGSHQPAPANSAEAFLVKFNGAGVRQWGTFYGGSASGSSDGGDWGGGVACDQAGNVYLTGNTTSISGIATPGSYQPAPSLLPFNPLPDAFLAKFNGAGVRQWGTYLGGFRMDYGINVCTGPDDHVYISGETLSPTRIATAGSHQDTISGPPYFLGGDTLYRREVFVAKFNNAGTCAWSTYYGGSENDYTSGIVCDSFGHVYVSGYTASRNGIATHGSYQDTLNTNNTPWYGADLFLAQFGTDGVLKWGSYYGSPGTEGDMPGTSVSCDKDGAVYLGSTTDALTGIATPGSHQETSNGGGCDAMLVKFYHCDTPNASIFPAQHLFCPGDSLTLHAAPGAGQHYQWLQNGQPVSGGTSSQLTVHHSAVYTLVARCSDSSLLDTASKTVTEVPFALALNDTATCLSNAILLQPSFNGSDSFSYTYQWTPAAGLNDPTVLRPEFLLPPGSYTYVLNISSSAPIACSTSDTMQVTMYPRPVLVTVPSDTTIRYGDDIVLSVSGADIYTWSPPGTLNSAISPTPLASPREPIIYTVTGISTYGCRDTASVRVNIDYTMPDFIPSAFSPNGDGRNDHFRIEGIRYQKVLEFRVFNRWGEQVFSSVDARRGWDGTLRGVPAIWAPIITSSP